MTGISSDDLLALLERALTAAGFSPASAAALARQTVLAEELGQASVGAAHVFDYLDGIAAGRIDGSAEPEVSRPLPAIILVDGHGGLPQTGFDRVFDELAGTARKLGLCAFLQRNTALCGPLGTFPLRLADAGLVAFAATNGHPMLAGAGTKEAVFCTNPMAFAAPREGGPPLLIDQSSSATAFVNIRAAAEAGTPIPEGWALDADGNPTTDPKAAVDGVLLPFAGGRGSNIALMVDVLAGGLTGANWSLDAPSFFAGDSSPETGLFVLAIDPSASDLARSGQGFAARLGHHLRRLANDYGLYIPGLSKGKNRQAASSGLDVDVKMLARLEDIAGVRPDRTSR